MVSTSDSDHSVSPANTGWGSLTSSIWRFAKTFWLTSVTLCPTAIAIVSVEFTSGLANSVRAAYCASKWVWFVFIVSNVNHVLSLSVTVRPSGCW